MSWEEAKAELDRKRTEEWGPRVAKLREKYGFFVCPLCSERHTTTTITCRKCGYNTLPKEKA